MPQKLTTTQAAAKTELMLKPAIGAAYGLMATCSMNMGEMEFNLHGWLHEVVSRTDSEETEVAKIIQQTAVLIYSDMETFKASVNA